MAKKKRGIYKFGLKHDTKWDVPKISEEERRQRTCGEKELRSERDAKTQAQLLTAKGEKMDAYECPYCGYWHIGHKYD
jgi:hypothetical protein